MKQITSHITCIRACTSCTVHTSHSSILSLLLQAILCSTTLFERFASQPLEQDGIVHQDQARVERTTAWCTAHVLMMSNLMYLDSFLTVENNVSTAAWEDRFPKDSSATSELTHQQVPASNMF